MEKIKLKTFDKVLTEEERKALYIKETILKIFENNTLYSNSEVFEKYIEVFFVNHEEKIEFVVEESPIHSEYDQIVKYELLEDIYNKAHKEGEIKGLLYARDRIVEPYAVPAEAKIEFKLKELGHNIEE